MKEAKGSQQRNGFQSDACLRYNMSGQYVYPLQWRLVRLGTSKKRITIFIAEWIKYSTSKSVTQFLHFERRSL